MIKPKILFISYAFYPDIGGIEVNSEILSTHFYKLGYPIRLITSVQREGEKSFPFPVIRNPSLVELFKQHKWADVVFENNPSLRLSWMRILFGSKSVIAIRTRVNREDGTFLLQDKLKLLSLKRADGVIAVSSALSKNFFPNATVIGNPFRNDIFKNLNQVRPKLSFAFLGRLVSEKGVHIALEALSIINAEITPGMGKPNFIVVGDGEELDNLKQIVIERDLHRQVEFLGHREGSDLVEILNKCRYLLVPSANEGFGNVALEGMACGCLPIVSDCGGLPEAVGDAGIKFKTFSSQALAAAIMKLIYNPNLEAEYRSKMNLHLEKHFPENVAKRYIEVIQNAYQSK